MSTTNKNKKKTVSEALLEMDKVSKNLKEESKATLSSLLSEAIREYLNEEIGGEEEEKEEEYSIEDDSTENDADDASVETGAEEEVPTEEPEENVEDLNEPEEGDGDEWSGLDDFKVDDETYDLTTGEKGDETLVKVYKLLKDTDQVVVKKDGDNVSLKDNETGAEYVIDLGGDEDTPIAEENDFEFEFDEDEVEPETEEMNNDEEDETMKEGKDMVYEIDLGYTDNYQDKDPIQGLSNNEPSKSGKSWHKGVPTGTEKPWASKGDDAPFDEKASCNEEELLTDIAADDLTSTEEMPVEEGTNVTLPNRRKQSKSHSMQQKDYPKVAHHDSQNGDYKALEEMCKKLQKENKEMKAMIPQIKKAMNESVLVNYKLGRIVKLISENATTRKEKIDIINRFNENAKTINETKALYESIKRELNVAASSKKTPMLESTIKAEKPQVVETTVYQSNDLKEMLDFMKRMEKC